MPIVKHVAPRRRSSLFVTMFASLFLACTSPLGSPLAVAAEAAATPSPSGATPLHSERELKALTDRIERLAERVLREAKGSGMAIAMVQGNQVLLERGFGVTDTTTSEKVDTDTVFRLASLSKAFAGTLAAILVDEGALSWESHVVDYLPEFKLKSLQSAQALTLQDILSHRVGLPFNAFDRLLEDNEPYPLLVNRLEEVDTICEAGECYGYQNIAFSLVGDMVFATTGQFYSQQVEKRIFHPLGMYSATYGRDGLEGSTRWARPHIRGKGRWVPVRAKETYYRIPPAAGVNASIHDLSLWMQAHLGHFPDVLSPTLLETVHAPQVATPGELRGSPWRRERLREAHYALGWRVYDYSGHTLIYHAGAVQGYRAMMGLLPEYDFGMVVVWNSESGAPSGLLATALDQYLKLPARDWLQLDKPVRRGYLR